MNHYCTYFDSGFMVQGLALWASLSRHDASAVLWVLGLDDEVVRVIERAAEPNLRVVGVAAIEAEWPELLTAKTNRTRVEYYFTLTPALPLWVLRRKPGAGRVTYLDADLFLFSPPGVFFDDMDHRRASVAITPHAYPPWLTHLVEWGRFNVGIVSFRNDATGIAVLEDWRLRCLEWCYDRVEPDRYADQKYLDAWPERWGPAIWVCDDAAINAAPWNWAGARWTHEHDGVHVNGRPLVIFHFAKFKSRTDRVWDSGQLEFAVMSGWLRQRLYGAYWNALETARTGPLLRNEFGYRRPGLRSARAGLRKWLYDLAFGSLWLRAGGRWWALGFAPLGRWSGRLLERARRARKVLS